MLEIWLYGFGGTFIFGLIIFTLITGDLMARKFWAKVHKTKMKWPKYMRLFGYTNPRKNIPKDPKIYSDIYSEFLFDLWAFLIIPLFAGLVWPITWFIILIIGIHYLFKSFVQKYKIVDN